MSFAEVVFGFPDLDPPEGRQIFGVMVDLLVPCQEEVSTLEHVGMKVIEISPVGLLHAEPLNPVNEALMSEMVSAEYPEAESRHRSSFGDTESCQLLEPLCQFPKPDVLVDSGCNCEIDDSLSTQFE